MMRQLMILVALCMTALAHGQEPLQAPQPEATGGFFDQLDLSPFDGTAVWQEGRFKSFESAANSTLNYVSGPRSPGRLPHRVALLDLVLRPAAWTDVDLHFVKKKPMRGHIVQALRGASNRPAIATDERLQRFMETGLAPRAFLEHPAVATMLSDLQQDVLRYATPVEQIQTSLIVAKGDVLRRELAMVPPIGEGASERPWRSLDAELEANPDSDVSKAWKSLQAGWRSGDAQMVNAAIAKLAPALRAVNGDIYPSEGRMKSESLYFRLGGLTRGWIIYLAAIIALLMWIVYGWRGALWTGYGLFLIAFALQTFAVFLRMYVAGRWPNTNMFEAVTTSTWFGGVFVVLIEPWLTRTRLAGLFVLGAAGCSMIALMAAHLDPVNLNLNISNRMPVLHDVWLYIHTNVIIFSYVLIFLASVTGLLYLVRRGAQRIKGQDIDLSREWARAGGAGFLIVPRVKGETALRAQSTTFGQVLDGATMILVELAAILLWAGLAMGAIWADHSWGRPWGWDPKEVFALESFFIFAILIHIRLTAKDKGWWTALLALVGCAAMIFNWIIINFTISGLHSYA
ncbi:MAG: cytochrome c biogenesis protein CcsA [Phycisphaerales bacterium]|nr:cytochrome c biogenesis protein CcsA [Phycisphaerales bacterium]